MMGIGFAELTVILVIIMIIFGAGKLPQIGSAFGQSIRNFKSSMREVDQMEAEEKVEEATRPSEDSAGATQVASLPAGEATPTPAVKEAVAVSNNAAPAKSPSPTNAPATAQAKTAQPQATGTQAPKTSKKGKGKPEEKSFEEELIEQAIKELKDKRIGTIRTPHDGLVQQGDVFTQSVDKTPWHLKGRDRGVNRDVL